MILIIRCWDCKKKLTSTGCHVVDREGKRAIVCDDCWKEKDVAKIKTPSVQYRLEHRT